VVTSSFETIDYAKEDGIAQIVLNRPKVLNAHNMQMRDDIYQVLEAIQDDQDVRCVLLRGEGERAFCTGADLSEFGTAPSRVIARQVRWERDLWGRFLSVDKPIIAALHGYVLGSGVEMALLCDMRIASEDAIFRMPEAALGMIPVAGGTQTMPRTLGVSRALDMLLSNEQFNAARALEVGLVHRLVSRELLLKEAWSLAKRFVNYPPHLLKAIKEAMRRGSDMSLGHALELELKLATTSLATK
jgi:enoyl-CoA hydratase/3-hydroxypropionyl-coenzyme A dehydratase